MEGLRIRNCRNQSASCWENVSQQELRTRHREYFRVESLLLSHGRHVAIRARELPSSGSDGVNRADLRVFFSYPVRDNSDSALYNADSGGHSCEAKNHWQLLDNRNLQILHAALQVACEAV